MTQIDNETIVAKQQLQLFAQRQTSQALSCVMDRTSLLELEPCAKLLAEIKQFLMSIQTCLLLRGEAGGGKTFFCHYLVQQLKSSVWSPIYVHMKPQQDYKQVLIADYLQSQGLTPSQIIHLKQQAQILFIFDGYEQAGQWLNLFVTQQLEQWNCKVIITCRSLALNHCQDSSSYFAPYKHQRKQTHLFKQLKLPLLSEEQIKAVFAKVVPYYYAQVINDSKLLGVAANPLMLFLLKEALLKLKITCLSDEVKAELYRQTIAQWFVWHEQKYKALGLLAKQDSWLEQAWVYHQTLAKQFQIDNTTRFYYQPRSQLFAKQTNPWSHYMGVTNYQLKLLCNASLLTETSNQYYSFLEPQLLSFFVKKTLPGKLNFTLEMPAEAAVINSLNKTTDTHVLNQQLMPTSSQIIRLLAERVPECNKFKQNLFDLINLTRIVPELVNAGANAITILNLARIPFSGLELSNIRIPGANLSHGIFHATNFSGADLCGVNLKNTFLHGANFEQARLGGIFFGKQSYKHSSVFGIDDLTITTAGQILALGYRGPHPNSHLVLWDVRQPEQAIYRPASRVFGISYCFAQHQLPWLAISEHAGSDKYIQVVNFEDMAPITELRGHNDRIICLVFSKDGQFIASATEHGSVYIWHVQSAKIIASCERGATPALLCLAFSNDNQYLAVPTIKHSIILWDFRTGQLIELNRHMKNIHCMIFHPSQPILASAGGDKTIKIWNFKDGRLLSTLVGHSQAVTKIAFTTDGLSLASISYDNSLRLWSMVDFGDSKIITESAECPMRLQFLPNDQQLAIADSSNAIHIIEITDTEVVQMRQGHYHGVASVAINSAQPLVASCGFNTICLWNPANNLLLKSISAHQSNIYTGIFSPNGKLLATASADKTIKIWQSQDGKLLHTLDRHSEAVFSLSFNFDGTLLASRSIDGIVKLWNTLDGRLLGTPLQLSQGSEQPICFVGKCYKDLLLACVNNNIYIQLFKLGTKQPPIRLIASPAGWSHFSNITSICLNPKGDWLVSASRDTDKSIRFWHIADPQNPSLLATQPASGEKTVLCMAFSSSGNYLVAGTKEGYILLWDKKFNLICEVAGHLNSIVSIDFYNEEKVITGGGDGALKIWQFDKINHQLYLSYDSNPLLNAYQARFIDTIGLTKDKQQLLIYNRAVVKENKIEATHISTNQQAFFTSRPKSTLSSAIQVPAQFMTRKP